MSSLIPLTSLIDEYQSKFPSDKELLMTPQELEKESHGSLWFDKDVIAVSPIEKEGSEKQFTLFERIDQGDLFGIFSGMKDTKPLYLISKQIEKDLSANNDVQTVFKNLFQKLNNAYSTKGSRAVVSLITNERVRQIYTATLGDCHAHLYQRVNKTITIKFLPLSPLTFTENGLPSISKVNFDVSSILIMTTALFRKHVTQKSIVEELSLTQFLSCQDVAESLFSLLNGVSKTDAVALLVAKESSDEDSTIEESKKTSSPISPISQKNPQKVSFVSPSPFKRPEDLWISEGKQPLRKRGADLNTPITKTVKPISNSADPIPVKKMKSVSIIFSYAAIAKEFLKKTWKALLYCVSWLYFKLKELAS